MSEPLRSIVARALHRSRIAWTSEADPWRGLSSRERKEYQREAYKTLRQLGIDPDSPVEVKP